MKMRDLINQIKKAAAIVLAICLIAALAACQGSSGDAERDENSYMIYYTDQNAVEIIYNEEVIAGADKMEQIDLVETLLDKMFNVSEGNSGFYTVKPDDVKVEGISIKDGLVTLDFNQSYLRMTNVREIILRASVALTLLQVPGVMGINFTVDQSPITNSAGEAIGNMTADTFVDVVLNKEGMLKQETDVTVYFANEDGTKLVPEHYSFTIDNISSSLEEYIISQIIKGPGNHSMHRTVAPDVSLISAVTTEGVCYVNFDKSFIEQSQPVNDEIMIYSIVNSLCELTYVHSVNFMVEGDSNITLHGDTDLSEPFVRDMTLIEATQ